MVTVVTMVVGMESTTTPTHPDDVRAKLLHDAAVYLSTNPGRTAYQILVGIGHPDPKRAFERLPLLFKRHPDVFAVTGRSPSKRSLFSLVGPVPPDHDVARVARRARRAAERLARRAPYAEKEQAWAAARQARVDSRPAREAAAHARASARMREQLKNPEVRAAMCARLARASARQTAVAAERRARREAEMASRRAERIAERRARAGLYDPAPPASPRPHQDEAVDAVVAGLCERGQLVMACGTGKTLVCAWVARRLDTRLVLVMVPSLALMGQTLAEWRRVWPELMSVAVCSDAGAVEEASDAGVDVPVTTDASALVAAMTRPHPGLAAGPLVVMCTYQSGRTVVDAQASCDAEFDLVVADEAHRCAGPQAGLFSLVLDGAAVRARRRLFTTATPRVVVPGAGVVSMDDVGLFGPVLHRLSYAESIRRGILCDYRVVVAVVPGPRDDRNDGAGAAAVAVVKAMRTYGLRRLISFHSRVASARAFVGMVEQAVASVPEAERPAGTVWAGHVNGSMSVRRRRAEMARLRRPADGEHVLVTNARCLSEGVDVPALDGVVFVDPRSSTVDVAQAVGRAIRQSPDKTVGTIIIPVVLPEGADHASLMATTPFKGLWEVLDGLRAHDDALWDAVERARRQLRADEPVEVPSVVEFAVDPSLDPGIVAALKVLVVAGAGQGWDLRMDMLRLFVEREGHLPPASYVTPSDGFHLGKWWRDQRQAGRRGELKQHQYDALSALPTWCWNPGVAAPQWDFDEAFAILQRFVDREGHADVGRGHVEGDFLLGEWVTTMRSSYSDRRQSPRALRFAALPGWVWQSSHAHTWARSHAALVSFVAANGRLPGVHDAWEGVALGLWASKQRARYQRGEMPADRVTMLEAVPGWVWRVG